MEEKRTELSVSVPKSMAVAYLLLIILGGFGAHRFYLGRKGTAITQLCLGVLGIILSFIGIGLVLYFILGIWLIVDLFLVPGMCRNSDQVVKAVVVERNESNIN